MPKKSIDAKQVEEFLVLNPDFLSSNSHILDSIEIVHKTGGAVSLIQKQVEVLRKNYESTSGNLLELLEIAKANEGIFEKTKELILDLIVCKNVTDVISTTENSFSKKFQADACKVLFFKENSNLPIYYIGSTPDLEDIGVVGGIGHVPDSTGVTISIVGFFIIVSGMAGVLVIGFMIIRRRKKKSS